MSNSNKKKTKNLNSLLLGISIVAMIGSDLQGPQHKTFISEAPYGCLSAGIKFKSYGLITINSLSVCLSMALLCFQNCFDIQIFVYKS